MRRQTDTAMKLPHRRQFLHLATGAAALSVMTRIAQAQVWPSRPVRFLVGFPAGGGADGAARIVAHRFSEVWGQQVVIENKGGAGGNIAIDAVAHAAPDGYTMLLGHPGLVINRFIYSSLTYDPVADFAPVSLIGVYGNLLVVSNLSPFKTFPEFLAYAKANPGKVTYATPGVGTSPHLAGELLKHRAGIDLIHVPYRGVAAGGLSDLIAGRVDCMFNTTGSLLQTARAGTVRGLAVTLAERADTAPEFPTIAESGVPGFDVSGWYGLLVPAKTPPDILRKMHSDAAAVLAEPAIRSKFEPLGVDVRSSSPEEFAARMRTESELWGPIIKAAGIKGE
jgi:tripartite-type tricarboxylate transporter receptor subunit TctC